MADKNYRLPFYVWKAFGKSLERFIYLFLVNEELFKLKRNKRKYVLKEKKKDKEKKEGYIMSINKLKLKIVYL